MMLCHKEKQKKIFTLASKFRMGKEKKILIFYQHQFLLL